MRNTKTQDTKDEELTKSEQNVLKVGYFQLQTKSFWISLVSILCLFLLAVIWSNIYAYNKMITKILEHEEIIVKTIRTNSKN
jgi:hypothetical protein